MNTKSHKTPYDLFALWQTEDQEMESCIGDLRSWMMEVNQLGIPHFGEAAVRLLTLRNRLLQHFDRENEIIESLANHFADSEPSMKELRSDSARDHLQIMERLDELMERLNELEPPFESWSTAMNEIEAFIDRLHQHESDESGSFATIMAAGDSQS